MTDAAEMTDERIAEIEARAIWATKGPWVTHSMNEACVYADFAEEGRIIDCRWQPKCGIDFFAASRNGRFVAHARTDIPDLIAALRAERERADGNYQSLDRVRDKYSRCVNDLSVARKRIAELEAVMAGKESK